MFFSINKNFFKPLRRCILLPEVSNAFVVVMGISVVFIGLICIVILCKILSAICAIGQKKTETETKSTVTQPVAVTPQVIENRQEIIAAVSAAVAEELGADISAIRILSFKKI